MNRFKKGVFVFCVFAVLFAGCIPDPIDIELPPYEPKMVVASQIIPHRVMIVGLTKSFTILSDATPSDTSVQPGFIDSILVKDALVTVSYLDKKDTLFMVSPGVYTSTNTLLEEYGTYTLEAKDPVTGKTITASSTILPQVKFDTIIPVVKKDPKDTIISINYRFTDVPGQNNWYVINFYKKNHDSSSSHFDLNTFFNRGSNKLLTNFELINDNDKAFENGIFSKEVFMEKVKSTDTIAVTISNISEGYFQFLAAYKRAGSLFNQLTGEPITYPTNVINGLGFFNTHYPDIRFIYLKNY